MIKKEKNNIINREITFPLKIGIHNITASPGDSVSSAFYYNKKQLNHQTPNLLYVFHLSKKVHLFFLKKLDLFFQKFLYFYLIVFYYSKMQNLRCPQD